MTLEKNSANFRVKRKQSEIETCDYGREDT